MQCQKDKFQLNSDVTYINCAYMAPLMKSSEEKGIEGLKRKRNPFEVKQEDFFTDLDFVKGAFAKIVGSEKQEVALCASVSYGFATILNSISPQNKKEVILVSNEFPSGYYAAKTWAEKHGLLLKIISPKDSENRIQEWNDDILEAISETSALVLISSIHWMDGSIFDLEKMGEKCKKTGTKFLIDGTQSVGALPMDVKKYKIDALVCATYKWLLGPYSSAIMYISPDLENGNPIEESWMNRTNAWDFSKLTNYEDAYFPHAGKFNVGQTNDFIKTPMLIDSFNQLLDWKVENIQAYCKNLIQPLCSFMNENGIFQESEKLQAQHLIGFKLTQNINTRKLLEDLSKDQIFLSLRGDFLRISPNVYNSEADIQKLIKILKTNIN